MRIIEPIIVNKVNRNTNTHDKSNFEIKLCLDTESYKTKPTDNQASQISLRIATNEIPLKNKKDIIKFVESVGKQGYAFCPATFKNELRSKANFIQMQLLALDFDDTIPLKNVQERAKEYQLPILFIYETFSSINQNRFRVIFLNNSSITDRTLAEIALNALLIIFPEADQSCKDVSRMFYGGKEILYFDDKLPIINPELLLRNMAFYLWKNRGQNHYKEHIKRLEATHKVRLNEQILCDISKIENVTEYLGTQSLQYGKNSPSAIIYTSTCGENPPIL